MEITQININEFYETVEVYITKTIIKEGLIKILSNNMMTNLDYVISSETYEFQTCCIVCYDINKLEIKV